MSYSHTDERYARDLHHRLENTRLPRVRNRRGEVLPRRLRPCFRDVDDLPASNDLGDAIRDRLKRSRNQIVVCSPAAAESRWVGEEVRFFQKLGRGERIFPIVVGGHLPGEEKTTTNNELAVPAAY